MRWNYIRSVCSVYSSVAGGEQGMLDWNKRKAIEGRKIHSISVDFRAWRVFPIADTTLSATGTVGALSDDLRRVGTEKLCHLSALYMSELVQMWGGIERVDGILSWGQAGSASAGVRVSGTAPGVQPAAVQIVQLGRPMPISTPALFLCPYPPHSDGPNGAGASLSLFPPYCESSGSKSSAKSSSSRPRYWTVR